MQPSKTFYIAKAALQMHDASWWRGFYSTAKLPGMAAELEHGATVAELRGRYRGIMYASAR